MNQCFVSGVYVPNFFYLNRESEQTEITERTFKGGSYFLVMWGFSTEKFIYINLYIYQIPHFL